MLKSISLKIQNTNVDFFFFQYKRDYKSYGKTKFHQHMNFEIHFAFKGAYEYEFEDKRHLLTANHMIIIPPGIKHKTVNSMDDNYRFKTLTLKFSSEKKDEFYDFITSAFNRHSMQIIELQDGDILQDVLALQSLMDIEGYLEYIHLSSCASRLFYRLCELLINEKCSLPSVAKDHLDVEIENLVNTYDTSLTEIANAINYSPRQTERIIKKFYGKTLTQIRSDDE